MDGFLNLLKPPGMTSHDVVEVVRRATKIRQAGHTGTLDPGAAGVVVVAVGFAVRLTDYLADTTKSYRAEITFGMETDTGDAQGEITREIDASTLREPDVREQMLSFVGTIEQRPPAYSAVQIGGRRLHELARQGKSVEASVRAVTVHRFELSSFQPGARPVGMIEVACSAGTYVRTLATDLGARLGCGAHVSFLLRTRAGQFQVEDSVTLEQLMAQAQPDQLTSVITTPQHALTPMPTVTVDAALLRRVRSGNPIAWSAEGSVPATGTHALIADVSGRVVAVGRCTMRNGSLMLQPVKVIPEEPAACA